MNNKGLFTSAVLLAIVGIALYQSWPNAGQREVAKLSASRVIETRDIGKNFYGVSVSREAKTASDFETIARSKCGSSEICKVGFWYDVADMPKNIPMTEKQVSAQVAQYEWVKLTGFNRTLVKCSEFPGTPSDKCF